jgi:murein DD-endopeptidase MepM/ murein hydrolase activator NlpD
MTWAALVAASLLGASMTAAAAQTAALTYHPPGSLAVGQGRIGDRNIYYPDIQFPLAVGPSANSAHAYANSQIHPPSPTHAYPWRDTYCERRSWPMPLCPGTKGHQGVDIRGSTNENSVWRAVAMDDGVVTMITNNTTVTIRSRRDFYCRYLHFNRQSISDAGLSVGGQIRKGDVIGKVSNIMGGIPDTTVHLHFDCYKMVNGETVRFPVYSSLIAAYRAAWGLDPLNRNGALGVDAVREIGASEIVAPIGDDPSLPKSFRTKNYGAITPISEPANWPPYIKTWPKLNAALEIRDAFGKIIPAFLTDEAGIGLWWYWMVRRAGFGRAGKISFQDIAFKYSGSTLMTDPGVAAYLANYTGTEARPGLARTYFGRLVGPDDDLSLADDDTVWRIAQTIFHHEGGRPAPFDRATFDRGVAFGDAVLEGTAIVGVAPGTEPAPTGPSRPSEPGLDRAAGMFELAIGRTVLRFGSDVDAAALARIVEVLQKFR